MVEGILNILVLYNFWGKTIFIEFIFNFFFFRKISGVRIEYIVTKTETRDISKSTYLALYWERVTFLCIF